MNSCMSLQNGGNVISEQNVNYALALLQEHKGSEMVEMDKDVICHTIQGKPVKPKTLGQKDYVDNIRKKMIVFGMGLPEPEKHIWPWPWRSLRLRMKKWDASF